MHDDYERIAQAIRFIRNNVNKQPTLAQIAAHLHLSEYHFQRLFSRWAGVTPKRYLQALTLERAKTVIDEQPQSMLNTSYEVGLSSGSRLYDHFVEIEAVTPSEFKLKGRGLTIEYGSHPSPYGLIFIAQTSRGICQLDFVEQQDTQTPLEQLMKNWPNARFAENQAKIAERVNHLFNDSQPKRAPISLWVHGTNFQLNVWRALLKIKPGETASYTDIAKQIGKPKAVRAVGTANGANPIPLLIPCHRVLRQDGDLGGYRAGKTRKQVMLVREAARCNPLNYQSLYGL